MAVPPEGGTPHARFSSRASESPLHRDLHVVREAAGANWGFFLRAETMHGLYTYLEGTGQPGLRRDSPALHEVSHGESFWEILQHRFDSPGFYVLDPHGPGWSERAWEDLTLVNHHRGFLRNPQRYLRHLRD